MDNSSQLLEIYNEYYDRVKKFARAYVREDAAAEDLAQETMMRVMEKKDSLDDPAKLPAWIFSVARNLCHDYYRSRKRCGGEELTDLEFKPQTEEVGGLKRLEQKEMSACVRQKTDLLPTTLKDVLVLYDAMGFNHSEVANILNITVKNAKVRLHRARQKMKTILEQECTFEKDERSVLTCEPKSCAKK